MGSATNTGNLVAVTNGGRVVVTDGLFLEGTGNEFDLNRDGLLTVFNDFDASMGGFNFNAGGSLYVGGALTGFGSAIEDGRMLGISGNWDQAVVEYLALTAREPENLSYRASLLRAKIRASQEHFKKGRKFHQAGVLDRALVEQGLYPAVDPLSSFSRILDPRLVGDEHYRAARGVQEVLQRYKDLQDIIAILGVEELSDEDKLAVTRARATGVPAVFWLDSDRAHDAQLIKKIRTYLADHDTDGLEIKILAPREATVFSLERIRKGEDTISVTGKLFLQLRFQ